MASRSDIQAGRAYIELYVKNSALVKGLRAAQESLQGFGTRIAGIGAGLTALGSAIVAPIGAAIAHFMKFGSELNDLSARTGVTAGGLAELKFAAEQSGASLEDVEVALKTMAKKGLGTDIDAQAARIAAIEDPAERAAEAIETFGKSGTKLLPMLANLKALRQEARDAGLVPSEEAVSVADALGDAFDKVRSQALAALFEIGAAVGPVLLPALKIVTNIAAASIRWVKENQAVIRTIAAIGAGLVAAGAAVTTIGATIFGAGAAFGVAASVLTGIASAVAFLVSPVGLVVGGLVAGAIAWVRFTASGKAAVAAIMEAIGPLIETIRTLVGGIGDALMAGDLQLAGQIAVKGLQVIFMQGVDFIASAIGGTFGAVIGDIGSRLIQGDLRGAWETVIAAMAKLWADFSAGIVSVFTSAANMVVDTWKGAVKSISNSLLETSAGGGLVRSAVSTVLGVDLQKEQDRLNEFNRKGAALGTGFNAGQTDVLGGAKDAANASVDAMAAPIKAFLEAMQQTASGAAASEGSAVDARTGGGNDTTAQLQRELEELRKQAAQAKQAANRGAGANVPDLSGAAEGKTRVVVGTSAAALIAQLGGGGDSPQKRIAKAAEEHNKKLDVVIANQQRQLDKRPEGFG